MSLDVKSSDVIFSKTMEICKIKPVKVYVYQASSRIGRILCGGKLFEPNENH